MIPSLRCVASFIKATHTNTNKHVCQFQPRQMTLERRCTAASLSVEVSVRHFSLANTLFLPQYCRDRKHAKPMWFCVVSCHILWFTFTKAIFNVLKKKVTGDNTAAQLHTVSDSRELLMVSIADSLPVPRLALTPCTGACSNARTAVCVSQVHDLPNTSRCTSKEHAHAASSSLGF